MAGSGRRRAGVWIALLIASALGVVMVFRYCGDAFSVLDLDVRMSRDQAIAQAQRIAVDRKLSAAKLTVGATLRV